MSCGTHTDVVFSNESDAKARQFCIKNQRCGLVCIISVQFLAMLGQCDYYHFKKIEAE